MWIMYVFVRQLRVCENVAPTYFHCGTKHGLKRNWQYLTSEKRAVLRMSTEQVCIDPALCKTALQNLINVIVHLISVTPHYINNSSGSGPLKIANIWFKKCKIHSHFCSRTTVHFVLILSFLFLIINSIREGSYTVPHYDYLSTSGLDMQYIIYRYV